MKAIETYSIYQFSGIFTGFPTNRILDLVMFKDISNSFNSEKEAIQALIDRNKTLNNYVIIKQIFITEE